MDIKYTKIDELTTSDEILKNEIKNISVFYHKLNKNETYSFSGEKNVAKVFILAEGEINVDGIGMKNKGIFACLSDHTPEIKTILDSALLEIKVIINEDEADKTKLPYYLNYEDAVTYSEDCKSEKTISRFLLKQRIIPGLAIGSVETYGPDEVGAHTHPYVEQLFFGFSEHDVVLMIDGEPFNMGGNTLVHIPLASNHGVVINEGKAAHYVWIDYIIDEENGLKYMDNAHTEL